MFYLPQKIISLIYQFDPTYRKEYCKSLKMINKLPPYIQLGDPYKFQRFSHKTCHTIYTYYMSSQINFLSVSINPPSKCYFNILKNLSKE